MTLLYIYTQKICCLVLTLLLAGPLCAQDGGEFEPLFDGESLDGWAVENSGAGNFYVQDGVLRVEEPEGWLRSERRFEDFILRVEFRFPVEDSDSGIFVRAVADRPFIRGWPGNSYQVQTRDISVNRSDRPLWLGHLYRHNVEEEGETEFDREALLEAYTGVGEWQIFEIEVTGDSLTVWLNGAEITRAGNIENPSGYIGLQGETGVVEYRMIEVREL